MNIRLKALLKPLIFSTALLPLFLTANPATDEETEAEPEIVEGIKSRDGRWFEVEVILFEHSNSLAFRETFANEVSSKVNKRQWELITPTLKPDFGYLKQSLPNCWQQNDPFYKTEPEYQHLDVEVLDAETKMALAALEKQPLQTAPDFYQQVQDYKKLLNDRWQIANNLCLLPNEKLSLFWALQTEPVELTNEQLTAIPIEQTPVRVTAGDHDDLHNVYLIAEQNLQLKTHYQKLLQNRKTKPLLHIGWRQPGLAKSKARPMYLYAGKNHSDEFNYDGSMKYHAIEQEYGQKEQTPAAEVEQQQTELNQQQVLNQTRNSNLALFLEKLSQGAVIDFENNQLLYPDKEQNAQPENTWTIDGFITVHLDHYLYLNAEFNYRQLEQQIIKLTDFEHYLQQDDEESEQNTVLAQGSDESAQQTDIISLDYLKTYDFKQNRRLYSGDIHYLDHPKFGMLVQIRKYRH